MARLQPRSIPARLTSLIWHLWYPILTGLSRDAAVNFLNYGYAGESRDGTAPPPRLNLADELDRPCIQLYHRITGAIDLRGFRILEVSCGHGGGASYIARYLGPAAVHAIDRNPRAVTFCRRRHRGIGALRFTRGDALALQFAAHSFDAVLNVEASHCYLDVPRFLSEVRRVLRPGGRFLYADFRLAGSALDLLKQQLADSGLGLEVMEDISAGVVRGIELNTPRYQALIQGLAPPFLHATLARFAGVVGSPMHRELMSGETVYLRAILRKPMEG